MISNLIEWVLGDYKPMVGVVYACHAFATLK